MSDEVRLGVAVRLEELEREIQTGGERVGMALIAIKNEGLWNVGHHSSFQEYCRIRWGFGKAYAYRLIEFCEIKQSPIGDSIKNESQARSIAKVKPEKRAKVLEVATAKAQEENKPLTARHIEEAAAEESPFKPDEPEEEKPEVHTAEEEDLGAMVSWSFGKWLNNWKTSDKPEVKRIVHELTA